jgi:hypothetical protein
MTALSVEEFDRLVASIQHSLWRWEAQPAYYEPEEAEPLARWQAGESDDLAWLAAWHEQLRAATQAGKVYQRVRRLTEPLTAYLAWGLTIAPSNVAAGEDIRLLTERQAARLGMPRYDFVIIDDRVAALMKFSRHGFAGAELLDAADLVRHRAWRDAAWDHAVTVDAYAARSP